MPTPIIRFSTVKIYIYTVKIINHHILHLLGALKHNRQIKSRLLCNVVLCNYLICLFGCHQMQIPLEVVKPLGCQNSNGLQLSLAGDHQLVNASLAVSLCKSWLRRTGNSGELLSNVGWLPIFLLSCTTSRALDLLWP